MLLVGPQTALLLVVLLPCRKRQCRYDLEPPAGAYRGAFLVAVLPLEQWLHERVVVQTCSLWQGHQSVPMRCSWQAASVRISVKSTACLAMPTVSAGAWKRWRQAENSWPKPRTDALPCRSHRQWSWGSSGTPRKQPNPTARGAQDARRHRGFSTSPASCKVGYCMVRPVRCGSLN